MPTEMRARSKRSIRVPTHNRHDEDVFDVSILVVDDEAANVRLLQRILERLGYRSVRTAGSARDALTLAAIQSPDIMLLDLNMPEMDGIALMRELAMVNPASFPFVIVLTGDDSPNTKADVLSAGAIDFIGKPFSMTEVGLRVTNLAELRLAYNRLQHTNVQLEASIKERNTELESARIEVLDRLAMAGELRDDATAAHTKRVGALAGRLAIAAGLSAADAEIISQAAPLHDVGKIAIPDDVLRKPGPLDEVELTLMRTHAEVGGKLLAGGGSPVIAVAHQIAVSHHERWDGRGYPLGLAGEDIPLSGRIVAIADVYDALSHDRPYRRGYKPAEAIEIVLGERGQQFDPVLVDAFCSLDHLSEVSA